MKVKQLIFKDIPGAGRQIHAILDEEVACGEFTMKSNYPQPIIIATEPWIRFQPEKWDKMIEETFSKMVELYNETLKG